MDQHDRPLQEPIRLDSPNRRGRGPTPNATVTPIDPGCAYSRFSLALVRHPPEPPYTGDRTVDSPAAVVPYLHQLLQDEPAECLGALFLTVRNHPIGHAIPFRGTISCCKVEPRPFLVMALAVNAARLALFHNHPSGDSSASPEDRDFARRFREAGDVVGVSLFDFIVLGEPPSYYSFRGGRQVDPRPSRPETARPFRRRVRRRKPKYRHPDEPDLTWAGTGFMPVWLREEIEGGAGLADFLVRGAKITKGPARQEQEAKDRARLREVAEHEDQGGTP